MELLFEAATIYREHHNLNVVQRSTLLSIKTGGCPEDCGYCPQAKRYHTSIKTNDWQKPVYMSTTTILTPPKNVVKK